MPRPAESDRGRNLHVLLGRPLGDYGGGEASWQWVRDDGSVSVLKGISHSFFIAFSSVTCMIGILHIA